MVVGKEGEESLFCGVRTFVGYLSCLHLSLVTGDKMHFPEEEKKDVKSV